MTQIMRGGGGGGRGSANFARGRENRENEVGVLLVSLSGMP